MSRTAQRQALKDTRNTMGVMSLLCFTLAGLSMAYLITYVMGANDPGYLARASAHAKALDLFAYRQMLWFCPVMGAGFIMAGLVAWFAKLKLLSL